MVDAALQFATIMSSFYVYKKILNIKSKVLENLLLIFFSCIFAAGMYAARYFDLHMRYGLLLISMVLTTGLLFRERIDITLSGTVLSLGLCYGVAFLSLTLTYILMSVLSFGVNNVYEIAGTTIIQIVLIYSIFRHPRLKKGFSFLKSKWWAGSVGMIIGGIILLSIMFLVNENADVTTAKGSLLIATAGLIILILWGLANLTRLYRETQYERCMREDAEIIAQLRESNDALSKLNHSDNKMLPAMYLSVNRFLMEAGAELSPELREKCDEIRGDLAGLMSHRQRFMPQTAAAGGNFPSTGIHTIDAVLDYMRRRAASKQIQFDAEVSVNLQAAGGGIPAGKLELLLSELLDNAIIAVSKSGYKRIRVCVTMENGCPSVSVSDSGIPFQNETLEKLGKERASTHLDEGGSGIGFMTICEAVREIKASLIISRHEAPETEFTKTITILFDGEDRFLIDGKMEPQESLISQ